MKAAAKQLEFERAALLRDEILELRKRLIDESDVLHEFAAAAGKPVLRGNGRRGRRPYRR